MAALLGWSGTSITYKGLATKGITIAQGIGNGLIHPDTDLLFNLTDYDSDYFAEYTAAIEGVQLYDTGVEIADGERMLSLQTCIEWHEESRQIAVCRQIFTMDIPEEWR